LKGTASAFLLHSQQGPPGSREVPTAMIRSYQGRTPQVHSTCYVDLSAQVIGDVTLGEHSSVWMNAVLRGDVHSIRIGNNVNIGDYLKIYTMGHDIDDHLFGATKGPVNIEDWAYIGAGVTILAGVNIEEGAVVATGAVVTKDVPAWTMVGGVPAKFIKAREVNKYTIDTSWKMPWR